MPDNSWTAGAGSNDINVAGNWSAGVPVNGQDLYVVDDVAYGPVANPATLAAVTGLTWHVGGNFKKTPGAYGAPIQCGNNAKLIVDTLDIPEMFFMSSLWDLITIIQCHPSNANACVITATAATKVRAQKGRVHLPSGFTGTLVEAIGGENPRGDLILDIDEAAVLATLVAMAGKTTCICTPSAGIEVGGDAEVHHTKPSTSTLASLRINERGRFYAEGKNTTFTLINGRSGVLDLKKSIKPIITAGTLWRGLIADLSSAGGGGTGAYDNLGALVKAKDQGIVGTSYGIVTP